MSLKELLLKIGQIAIHQKCCGFSAAGTSLYELNPMTINEYPFVFTSPTGNHRVYENYTEYDISIYWVDRLLQDYSNDVDVFSNSIEQIKNLVNWIRDIDDVVDVSSDYTIRNFAETEKMNDRTAGAYANIRVTVANNTICAED